MSSLLDSEYYEVDCPREGLLRVVRKDKPFASALDVERACQPVQRALDLAGRSRHALLIDTRRVRPRNDPSAEPAFRKHRREMVMGFKAVALVVETPVGRLQTVRLLQEDQLQHVRVFQSEIEASAYLGSAVRRSTSTFAAVRPRSPSSSGEVDLRDPALVPRDTNRKG